MLSSVVDQEDQEKSLELQSIFSKVVEFPEKVEFRETVNNPNEIFIFPSMISNHRDNIVQMLFFSNRANLSYDIEYFKDNDKNNLYKV